MLSIVAARDDDYFYYPVFFVPKLGGTQIPDLGGGEGVGAFSNDSIYKSFLYKIIKGIPVEKVGWNS